MLSFRLFSFPIHVQPWFWLSLGLIGGGLRASDAYSILLVLMFIIAGFISILVHELGHAFMIRKFGYPTEIHLFAFGGSAICPAGKLSRKESFLVTVAGPAIQFVLGLVALLFLNLAPIPPDSLMRNLLGSLIWVSLIWSILNCLPIFPMDGGQMLAAILGPQRQRTTYLVGMITAILIGLVGYLVLQAFLLAIFMAFFAYQNWQQYAAASR
ncbi:MAG: site-2 protease family protein [Verrucomicrobiota bacterium]